MLADDDGARSKPAPSAPPLEEDGDAAEAEEDEEADEQLVHVHVFESAAPERQQEKKLSREERHVARERARDEMLRELEAEVAWIEGVEGGKEK